MRKLVFFSACLAGLTALVSCETRVFAPEEPRMVPVTLTGSVPETRISLDGETPNWTAGDRLAVFTTDGTLCPAFTADEGGSATTTFSGTKPEGSELGFAIFPYTACTGGSGGRYSLTLPSTQDGTLGSAVMAARIGPGEEGMVFSNLLSVVRVRIPSGLRITRIELQREDRVCGAFTLDGNSLAVTPAGDPADAEKRVIVEKGEGFSGEEVLLCVLPSSNRQVSLLLTRADGKTALVSRTLASDFTAGHIKNATVPADLAFSDLARIGGSTATQLHVTATQPACPQVENGDFETWTYDGENLPNHWNSFQTADGTWASLGFSSSNRQVKRSTDRRPGSRGSYSCSIWSRKITSVVAQGNITTGRIHAGSTSASSSGNYNYTDRDGSTSRKVNNQTITNPCSMRFDGRPDSLVYWVKFVPIKENNADYTASVSAYLHDDSDFKTRADGTTGDGTLIGSAVKEFLGTNGKWVRHAVKFSYRESSLPAYLLLNVSTNKKPGGGATGDYLYIDDIEMIYADAYILKTGGSGWATLCVDFNARVPEGATAYYVTEVSGGCARLTAIPAGSVIQKDTGVLVKGAPDTSYIFEGSKNAPVSVSGNLLGGTVPAISRPAGTCRVLSSESTTTTAVFGAYTGTTIAAHTAWLTQ